MTVKWWNENKMILAPVASAIMWLVSVLCFVFGLSFKNPMGVMVGNVDVSIFIAFALSIANTIIQLIGNGQDFEKMDGVFKAGWYASYVLGIASNVNALIGILGIGNVMLEWAVAVSLGSMIEIMPEKLIVVWLKSVPNKSAQQGNNQQSKDQPRHPLDSKIADVLPKRIPYQPSRPNPAMKPGSKTIQTPQKLQPAFRNDPKPWPPQSSYLKVIEEEE